MGDLSASTGTIVHVFLLFVRFCVLVLFWSSIVFCLLFLLFYMYVILAQVPTEGTVMGAATFRIPWYVKCIPQQV